MWLVALACSTPPAPSPSEPTPPPTETGLREEAAPTVPGLIAARDLAPGQVIGADDVALAAVPDFTPAPLSSVEAALGATVREPVFAGEPLRRERIVGPGGPVGYEALAGPGEVAVTLRLPAFAAAGLEPGCLVEVVRAERPGGRPRLAVPGAVRILGMDPSTEGQIAVVVSSPRPVGASSVSLVSLPLSERLDHDENQGPATFTPAARPGPPVAVARRTLEPGVMIRDADLAEIGGAGVEGLSLPVVWAQIPSQPVYPGELPHPLRLAAPGRGMCTTIPEGMRAVAIPMTSTPGDWVGGLVRAHVRGIELEDLYVGAIDSFERAVVVFALPDHARAIAAATVALGERFDVTPRVLP